MLIVSSALVVVSFMLIFPVLKQLNNPWESLYSDRIKPLHHNQVISPETFMLPQLPTLLIFPLYELLSQTPYTPIPLFVEFIPFFVDIFFVLHFSYIFQYRQLFDYFEFGFFFYNFHLFFLDISSEVEHISFVPLLWFFY